MGDRTLRHGLRAFGSIGWSIVIPTLLGIAFGGWLDRRFGGGLRYTLSFMVAGLIIGFANAWKWMQSED
jgi:F0F1-ATPase subunit, putative